MQLIVPKDIEQWLDNTREHRSRAAQIIKLFIRRTGARHL